MDDYWYTPDVNVRLQQGLKDAPTFKDKLAVTHAELQEIVGLYNELAAGAFDFHRALTQRIPHTLGDKVPQIEAIVNIHRQEPVMALESHLEGPYICDFCKQELDSLARLKVLFYL